MSSSTSHTEGRMRTRGDAAVQAVIDSYPVTVREKIYHLRELIYKTARQVQMAGKVKESLKWGEPNYVMTGGSPIRLAWNKKRPAQYGIYFNCNTKLVDTFKQLYADRFKFEGNRAVIFSVTEVVPEDELQHCIHLALVYHKVKHLPLLGV